MVIDVVSLKILKTAFGYVHTADTRLQEVVLGLPEDRDIIRTVEIVKLVKQCKSLFFRRGVCRVGIEKKDYESTALTN